MFPEGTDMSGILAQAQAMQEQFARVQEEMANAKVTGSAGGGLVEVTMTGTGDIEAVALKPEIVDPDDIESLQDLIVAAFRDAQTKVEIMTQNSMGPLADGLGGGLPNLG